MISTVYHSVENTEDASKVERSAPFKCTSPESWFGDGYYVWETFIELAHWWGKVHYNNNYFVCESKISIDADEMLDLVGNTKQIFEVKSLRQELAIKYSQKTITARFVIEHMKSKLTKGFPFKAIRGYGINSVNTGDDLLLNRLCFTENNNKAYLDLTPAIQICVLDKKVLRIPMKIIYPEEYCEDFTI